VWNSNGYHRKGGAVDEQDPVRVERIPELGEEEPTFPREEVLINGGEDDEVEEVDVRRERVFGRSVEEGDVAEAEVVGDRTGRF
jgi:hypothetical protein